MNRRDFGRRILAAMALFAGPVGYSLSKSSNQVTREVTILFPNGKTAHDFVSDVSRWIDRKGWLSFLERASQEGHVLSVDRVQASDRFVIRLTFANAASLEHFLNEVNVRGYFDLGTLDQLGYKRVVFTA